MMMMLAGWHCVFYHTRFGLLRFPKNFYCCSVFRLLITSTDILISLTSFEFCWNDYHGFLISFKKRQLLELCDHGITSFLLFCLPVSGCGHWNCGWTWTLLTHCNLLYFHAVSHFIPHHEDLRGWTGHYEFVYQLTNTNLTFTNPKLWKTWKEERLNSHNSHYVTIQGNFKRENATKQ